MIANAGFATTVQPGPMIPAKNICAMTDAEFDAYIARARATITKAWLERAISWREASREYRSSDGYRAMARRFMRENALAWKARRTAEVHA